MIDRERLFWIKARITGFANRLEIGDPIREVIEDMRKYANEILPADKNEER